MPTEFDEIFTDEQLQEIDKLKDATIKCMASTLVQNENGEYANELVITNCTECIHHQVVRDPDPSDWFNDDDVAVLCNLSTRDTNSGRARRITRACRPYNVEKECSVPSWCPMRKV